MKELLLQFNSYLIPLLIINDKLIIYIVDKLKDKDKLGVSSGFLAKKLTTSNLF
jgi:hypothetical protein